MPELKFSDQRPRYRIEDEGRTLIITVIGPDNTLVRIESRDKRHIALDALCPIRHLLSPGDQAITEALDVTVSWK